MSPTNDPFDRLTAPDEPITPRPEFAGRLRERIALLVGSPTIDLTPRRTTMSTGTSTGTSTSTSTGNAPASGAPAARAVTPYLTVHDGPAALEFYASAFGALEVMRVVMDEDTGQLGHAEFRIGSATFYLSDEFPAMGVLSPRSLGGTSVALHVEVDDVDTAFAAAVDAGAQPLAEPADQPHGARHGTLVDPFGHRWMLSQQLEQVPLDTYGERMRSQGATVTGADAPSVAGRGGIWAALNFVDARAGIRFVVDVLGFEADLVVPGEELDVVEHSQLRWPEGGVVQAASANRPGNPFSERPPGTESLYVITADPMAVYRRCIDAGVEILYEPSAPDYDPDGLVFSLRDPEGNLWSFGTYAGGT